MPTPLTAPITWHSLEPSLPSKGGLQEARRQDRGYRPLEGSPLCKPKVVGVFSHGSYSFTVSGAAHFSAILHQTFSEWPVLDRCKYNKCHVSAPRSFQTRKQCFLFLGARGGMSHADMPHSDCPLWVPRRRDKTDGGEKGSWEGMMTLRLGGQR